MILCDRDLKARMALPEGDPRRLVVRPFVDYDDPRPPRSVSYGITSAGYDLRAGSAFLLFTNTSGCVVDPKDFRPENFVLVTREPGQAVVIPPNCFALAETVEYLEIPGDCVAHCVGKSTLARGGYVVPTTPFEPGFKGVVTLEVGNLSPLPMKVYAGEGLCQMMLFQLSGTPERDYANKPGAKYQGQTGLTPPRV